MKAQAARSWEQTKAVCDIGIAASGIRGLTLLELLVVLMFLMLLTQLGFGSLGAVFEGFGLKTTSTELLRRVQASQLLTLSAGKETMFRISAHEFESEGHTQRLHVRISLATTRGIPATISFYPRGVSQPVEIDLGRGARRCQIILGLRGGVRTTC